MGIYLWDTPEVAAVEWGRLHISIWESSLLCILVSHIALFYHLLGFRLNVHSKIDRNAIYRIQIFIWGSIYSWDTPSRNQGDKYINPNI